MITALAFGAAPASAQEGPHPIDRTVLPVAEPPRPTYSELDARNVKAPPRFEVKAPDGAPNVVVILIDDLGFGSPSTFGGPISMPTLDQLANSGLRYNNFHTTALCSPTRMALKTGRNHHQGETGSIMETSTGFPGNTGQLPNSVAPMAEMLRLNGYSTGAFGKWHETAAWETSVSGPYDRWPTHQGFDKFYGFIGGETNQWAPFSIRWRHAGRTAADPNYHFMTDMTDKAVAWIRHQQAMTPDKPFFVYFAPGATHAPHHVPKDWIARWKGKFDQGWDKLREETLARQIKLGVVPQGTQLAPKPEAIKDWDKLSADEKRLFARQAEVFAAFAEMTDYEIGRVVKAIEDMGELDNTLIIYIAGDNGASAEGGMNGIFNEMSYFNGVQEQVPDMLKNLDKWGGPETYPHMAAGWAVALNAPFTWTKQVASSYGGTRNGMVVHWPKGIKAKGEVRSQFHHVIDVAPTILEAAKLPEPKSVNGTPQMPMAGVSMAYSFDDRAAKDRHHDAVFRDLRQPRHLPRRLAGRDDPQGAVGSQGSPPAGRRRVGALRREVRLQPRQGSRRSEPGQARRDAGPLHEGGREVQRPADRRPSARALRRRDWSAAPTSWPDARPITLAEGMTGMMENVFLNVKNKSKTITAEIEVLPDRANGTIIAQGGRFGGWSLYVKDGVPGYEYNFLGLERTTIASRPR